MSDIDKLEFEESKEPWDKEEKMEHEGYKYIKYIIIGAFVGYKISCYCNVCSSTFKIQQS